MARLAAFRSHHANHRHLMEWRPSSFGVSRRVDALVVPTARPLSWMRESMALAAALDCVLVAVCSGRNSAADATHLGQELRVPTVALDMADCGDVLTPTSAGALIKNSQFEHDTDVSYKRNLALLLARIAGWESLLFIDDDIYDLDPKDAMVAVGLLDWYAAVGLRNAGFPDNSVVCHVFRAVGGPQEQFIGAGAMAVSPMRTRSFFPVNYNDDWFYFLGDAQPLRVAMTGSMRQKKFDPFAKVDRARGEELGDCLAEGLFWLLDERLPLDRADQEYWQTSIGRRARFIERLLVRVTRVIDDADLQTRMLASLSAALDINQEITADLCTEYVRRWRSDLVSWQQMIDDTPTGLGIDRALDYLGLSGVVRRSEG